MNTQLFGTTKDDIKKAAQILKDGGLVAFPTETVYGLGADAFDKNAAKKAYAAKGRPSDNPLIVHIADLSDLKRLVPEKYLPSSCGGTDAVYSEIVQKLSDAFWPGPMTIVLPKLHTVPLETTGGLESVAIRLPNRKETLELIKQSGTLLSGPSANLSGRPSPTTWKHVENDLSGKIDGIVCGENSEVGIESTVISLLNLPEIKILRPGFITPEMISQITGLDVSYDSALLLKPVLDEKGNVKDDPNFHPSAPGMKYKHYAPKAELVLLKDKSHEKEFTKDFLKRLDRYIEEKSASGKKVIKLIPTAKDFYALLRSADEEGADLIVAPTLPDDSSLSFSIMNRVLKAAGYHIEEI